MKEPIGKRKTKSLDAQLSSLIDDLIDQADEAQIQAARFADVADDDLAGLIQLASQIRAVSHPEPRLAWVEATKQQLMTVPVPAAEPGKGSDLLAAMMLPLQLLPWAGNPWTRRMVQGSLAAMLVAGAVGGAYMVVGGGLSARWAAGPTAVTLPVAEETRVASAKDVAELRDLAALSANGTPVAADEAARLVAELGSGEDTSESQIVLAEVNGLELLLSGDLSSIDSGTIQIGKSRVAISDPSVVSQLTVGQPVQVRVKVQANGQMAAVAVLTPTGQQTTSNSNASAATVSAATVSASPASGASSAGGPATGPVQASVVVSASVTTQGAPIPLATSQTSKNIPGSDNDSLGAQGGSGVRPVSVPPQPSSKVGNNQGSSTSDNQGSGPQAAEHGGAVAASKIANAEASRVLTTVIATPAPSQPVIQPSPSIVSKNQGPAPVSVPAPSANPAASQVAVGDPHDEHRTSRPVVTSRQHR